MPLWWNTTHTFPRFCDLFIFSHIYHPSLFRLAIDCQPIFPSALVMTGSSEGIAYDIARMICISVFAGLDFIGFWVLPNCLFV